MQLVGLPLGLLLLWHFVAEVGSVVFVFVLAALVAILLNPIVRALTRLHIPRPAAVLLVYTAFLAALAGVIFLLATVLPPQISSLASTVQDQFQPPPGGGPPPAVQKLRDFQHLLNANGLGAIHVAGPGTRLINHLSPDLLGSYAGRAVDVLKTVGVQLIGGIFTTVLLVVISIYMLLDAQRLTRWLRTVFPHADPEDGLIRRCERALVAYVRGQALVSIVIGASSGLATWILGMVGVFPAGRLYAPAFGAWAMATEAIPYLGPWLGALPPLVVGATESLSAVVAVAVAYLIIQELEGHVVVPKLMGNAVRAHPLAVIFALLAGEQVYGFAGVLLALPILAVGREIVVFLYEHLRLESWPRNGSALADVPLELHAEPTAAESTRVDVPVRADVTPLVAPRVRRRDR